jgi:hypothetical protein
MDVVSSLLLKCVCVCVCVCVCGCLSMLGLCDRPPSHLNVGDFISVTLHLYYCHSTDKLSFSVICSNYPSHCPSNCCPDPMSRTIFFPTSLFYPEDKGNRLFWNIGNTAYIIMCHHPKAESTSNFCLSRTQLSHSVGTVH